MKLDGKKLHGQFAKHATVTTNDPAKRTVTITLAGTEIPYLRVEPSETLFLHAGYGEQAMKTVTLSSNEKDLKDFKVTRVTSNVDDKLTYTVEPTQTPGEYQLTVYKNPNLPTLTTYGMLFIDTNSPNAPRTEIQVNVMTRGDITVSPITLNFGAVRFGDSAAAGTPVTKSVILSKRNGAFDITGIDVNNPNFHAKVEPITKGSQYRVLVTFQPPMKRESRQSETADMIVHTNDPREPAIRVTVVARTM